MAMQQSILVRDGMVRCVVPGAADTAAKRRAVFGADDDGERDLAAEGTWHTLPADAPTGEGWAWTGTACVPPAPALTDYGRVVGEHVHAVARSRGYDDGVSMASYATDPDPAFKAEALAFVAWRSAVWKAVAARMAAVQDGAPAPGLQELVTSLPAIVWPA
jgi:hypothetical protein